MTAYSVPVAGPPGASTEPRERDIDILLLGASGFTGAYIAAELWRVTKRAPVRAQLRLGLAGRNMEKLRRLSEQVAGEQHAEIRLISADISNVVSLDSACRRCRLLINACGPFYRLGEPVVRACLRTRTHYLDICGERLFIERCQMLYSDQAQRARIYCVSTCGFDSVPTEVAVELLQRRVEAIGGELNGARCYLHVHAGAAGYDGVHQGTWVSSIHGTRSELAVVLQRWRLGGFGPGRSLPPSRPRLASRAPLHRCSELGGAWCLPFPGPDVSVHARSQLLLRRGDGKACVQLQQFVVVSSWWRGLVILLTAIVFALLCYLPGGQRLLLRWPSLFSAGLVSARGGPNEKQVKQASLTVVAVGEGWRNSADRAEGQKPDMKLTARLQLPEPAYSTTALCIAQCALCVLEEPDRMPGEGGVLPPGAAFANTSLIERLCENGVTMTVTSDDDGSRAANQQNQTGRVEVNPRDSQKSDQSKKTD